MNMVHWIQSVNTTTRAISLTWRYKHKEKKETTEQFVKHKEILTNE